MLEYLFMVLMAIIPAIQLQHGHYGSALFCTILPILNVLYMIKNK